MFYCYRVSGTDLTVHQSDGLWKETVLWSVICSTYQKGEVGAGCVQAVLGLQ